MAKLNRKATQGPGCRRSSPGGGCSRNSNQMAKPKATRLTITEFQAAAGKFSQETLRLNPDLAKTTVERPWNARQHASEPKKAPSTVKPSSDGPKPNKTELRFREYWERETGFDESARPVLHFAAITLRIGRRRYTPDWVFFGGGYIRLLEVKGPWIEDDAKLKYDLFKTHYEKESAGVLIFEMWQEVDRVWTPIR